MKTESGEHLKPRSQYADDAVQLAIAGKWDDAVKLNKFIIDSFGADEETQNRLGKALSELGKLKDAKSAYEGALKINPMNLSGGSAAPIPNCSRPSFERFGFLRAVQGP